MGPKLGQANRVPQGYFPVRAVILARDLVWAARVLCPVGCCDFWQGFCRLISGTLQILADAGVPVTLG